MNQQRKKTHLKTFQLIQLRFENLSTWIVSESCAIHLLNVKIIWIVLQFNYIQTLSWRLFNQLNISKVHFIRTLSVPCTYSITANQNRINKWSNYARQEQRKAEVIYDCTRSLEVSCLVKKKHLLRHRVRLFISTPSWVWNGIFLLAWPWRDHNIFFKRLEEIVLN